MISLSENRFKSKLTIYNPTPYFGGASILFLRIFKKFRENNIDVVVIDYYDGFIASRSSAYDENIIKVSKDLKLNASYEGLEDRAFLCTTTQLCSLKSFCHINKINPKVFMWVVHPFEASISFIPFGITVATVFGLHFAKLYTSFFPIRKHFLKKLMLDGIKKNYIHFMDGSCFDTSCYFLTVNREDIKSSLLPIPAEAERELQWRGFDEKKGFLHICYFGRVEDFKIGPLLGLILELEKIHTKNKFGIKLTIIGGGRDLEKVSDFVKTSISYNVVFKGVMENKAAKIWMSENIDVLFAMGTAALDGSSIGIPTVLLNPTYCNLKHISKPKINKYNLKETKKFIIDSFRYLNSDSGLYDTNWLYKQKEFNLGRYNISRKNEPSQNGHKQIYNVLTEYLEQNEKISTQSKEHVGKRHSLDDVCLKVLQLSSANNVFINDIPYYFKV